MSKIKVVSSLALLIAIIAPLWAAVSAYAGLATGAAAMICAGLYVISGSKLENAVKITLGLLGGNVWGFLVISSLTLLGGGISPYLLLFLVLFVFSALAVYICLYLDKVFDLAAWLTGMAISITILLLSDPATHFTMLWHTAIAMIAGIWIIGVLTTQLHRRIVEPGNKK